MTLDYEKLSEELGLQLVEAHEALAEMKEKLDESREQNAKLVDMLGGDSEPVTELRLNVLELEGQLGAALTLIEEEYGGAEAVQALLRANSKLYVSASLLSDDEDVLAAIWKLVHLGRAS